jgi:hypothetical protein
VHIDAELKQAEHPELQLKQLVDPAVEFVPSPHVEQVRDIPPLEYVPGSH